ncbi:unnamed protein product, partial [Staurois parvus]
ALSFAAFAVKHRVPASDSCWQPVITEYHQLGRDLCTNNTDLSPVSCCTLLCMALHNRASVKHTHSTQ